MNSYFNIINSIIFVACINLALTSNSYSSTEGSDIESAELLLAVTITSIKRDWHASMDTSDEETPKKKRPLKRSRKKENSELEMWTDLLKSDNLAPTTRTIAKVRLGEMHLLGIGTKHSLYYAVCNLADCWDTDNGDLDAQAMAAFYLAQVWQGNYKTWGAKYRLARFYYNECFLLRNYIESDTTPYGGERSLSELIKLGPAQLSLHALIKLSIMDANGHGLPEPNITQAKHNLLYALNHLDFLDTDNESIANEAWSLLEQLFGKDETAKARESIQAEQLQQSCKHS